MTVNEVRPLLASCGLPIDDLNDERVNLLGLVEDGTLVGCVGVEHYGKDALLRSLAVAKHRSGNGIGAALLQEAMIQASAEGCRVVWGVTTSADAYLTRFGFEVIDRDLVPDALAASTQLRGACPDDALVMRRVMQQRRKSICRDSPGY